MRHEYLLFQTIMKFICIDVGVKKIVFYHLQRLINASGQSLVKLSCQSMHHNMPPSCIYSLQNVRGVGGEARKLHKAETIMSLITRIRDFRLCENKGTDQLCSDCTADLSAFVFATWIVLVNRKFQGSSLLLLLYRSVCA